MQGDGAYFCGPHTMQHRLSNKVTQFLYDPQKHVAPNLFDHEVGPIVIYLKIDFKVQHLFRIQDQKRNQGTLIKTGRNRPVSRNQTAIFEV